MLSSALKRGNCSFCCEIWIKPKESSVRPFSHYSQVFTRVEGGETEAPVRQLARWGLLLNRHRTSLAEKSNFNTRVCFYDYFCVVCTGRRTFNSFRNGAKNSTIQTKAKYDDFQPVGEAAETLCGLWKNWLKLCGDDAPSKLALRLPIGEKFLREANGTRGAFLPRQQMVFYHRFLNNYFMP